MQLGDKSLTVGILQGDLTSLGFQTVRDNEYGPHTVKSVKAFQDKYGLLVDGEAGPITLAAIAKAKAPKGKDSKTFGLDVSAWQPHTDWTKVAASGCKFAFIKATEGLTYVSSTFKNDYKAAKAAGILCGTYHFFHANKSGSEQANHYITTVLNYVEDRDLPFVLDLETMDAKPQVLIDEAIKFLNICQGTLNKRPILYTNPAMLTYIKETEKFKNYPLWLAAPERDKCPEIAPWGGDWKFWQYTFKGKFEGTTGQDGNYFNGTLDDLLAFAKAKVNDPKPPTTNPDQPLVVPTEPTSNAPWMTWMANHEGLTEAKNSREIADLVWPHTNYSGGQKAHTVTGDKYAWCAATVNAALENSGFKGNRSAQAQSFETFGQACDLKFGAILPLRHQNGGHHATFFHHWVDESKRLAACLGGNQSNALKISTYNLSGNAKGCDQVVPSPRWPVVKL